MSTEVFFHVVHHTEKDSYTWLFLDSALNEYTSQEKRSLCVSIRIIYRFTVNEMIHAAGEAMNSILFKYKNSNKHILYYRKCARF